LQLLIFLFLSWSLTGQITSAEQSEPEQQGSPDYRIALSTVTNPSFTPNDAQLGISLKAGITLFEVSSLSDISRFSEQNISLLFHADVPYPTVHYLNQNRSNIIESVSDEFSRLSTQQQSYIAAIGLFRYPADFLQGFFDVSAAIADSVSSITNKPLYYHSFSRENYAPAGISFIADRISAKTGSGQQNLPSSAVVYLQPSSSYRESLNILSEILESSRDQNESIIILPADWFFDVSEKYPAIISVLKNYTEGRFITMPLPAKSPDGMSANPGVILLLLIFAGLIIQYKYQPVVLQYAGRYFFNHPFFMSDIMDNRMRSATPGLTFMGIHSVVNGLFFLTLFDYFFSGEGLNILSLYFAPEIAQNFELYIIFLTAVIAGFFFHFIAIIWLLLLNRQVNSFSKALNLYIWPFTFTLIPTVILVFNNHTGHFDGLAIAMTIIYLLTWIAAFATASINAARRLEKYRVLNLIFTTGLYSLIFAGLCTVIVMVPSLFEPLELALKIS